MYALYFAVILQHSSFLHLHCHPFIMVTLRAGISVSHFITYHTSKIGHHAATGANYSAVQSSLNMSLQTAHPAAATAATH